MLNKLLGTTQNLFDFAKEQRISIEEVDINEIEECSSCSIWHLKKNLIEDLDGNPICPVCEKYYGK